jgi:hypothetical protein
MLIHLGVMDLSTSSPSLGLTTLFPQANQKTTLDLLLSLSPPASSATPKSIPKQGPSLTADQAFILRASAIDACELIVETARNLTDGELKGENGADHGWLKNITLPQVDAWLWSVAKDRADYRALERFAERDTVYY